MGNGPSLERGEEKGIIILACMMIKTQPTLERSSVEEADLTRTMREVINFVHSEVVTDFILKVVLIKLWGTDTSKLARVLDSLVKGTFITKIKPDLWRINIKTTMGASQA
jgi:hypothetical protein